MKNLLALAALVFALPLAACTQPVGDASTSTDPLASSESAVAPALTRVEAKFARWIPSPTGQTVGMLLDDGTFVRVQGDTKTDALAAGDVVQVEGFKHDSAFVHASIKKGDTVIAEAPKEPMGPMKGKHGKKHDGKKHDGKKHDGKKNHEWKGEKKHGEWKHAPSPEMQKAMEALVPMTVKGTVTAVLPGRHGKVHALILSDGTVVYAKHHKADFAAIKQGDAVELSGKGGTWATGKSMIADAVTPVDAKAL